MKERFKEEEEEAVVAKLEHFFVVDPGSKGSGRKRRGLVAEVKHVFVVYTGRRRRRWCSLCLSHFYSLFFFVTVIFRPSSFSSPSSLFRSPPPFSLLSPFLPSE